VALPADRFDATNAELMRFAKACGVVTVRTGLASLSNSAAVVRQTT
jgi:hypothetical protein